MRRPDGHAHWRQGTQPQITEPGLRHGASAFGSEPSVSSRGLLLRHDQWQGRWQLRAPTGICPCSPLRVLLWCTQSFLGHGLLTSPCEFPVAAARSYSLPSALAVNWRYSGHARATGTGNQTCQCVTPTKYLSDAYRRINPSGTNLVVLPRLVPS